MADVPTPMVVTPFDLARDRMVRDQLLARGIRDRKVLHAFKQVPREEFIAPANRAKAYADEPLPIGYGQTISQPYMVALMTHCLELCGTSRVLEVGTGSGYQAAVLSRLAREVHSVERIPELAHEAQWRLRRLGYMNVVVVIGDGSLGWPEGAPYDGIIVTAAAPEIPEPLVRQLAEGGRLVIPIGDPKSQQLVVATKEQEALRMKEIIACVFVPLVGEKGWAAGPP